MNRRYVCQKCSSSYEPEPTMWRCHCGGLFNLSPPERFFEPSSLATRESSLWRYWEALPFGLDGAWRKVTMGEGMTPLISVPENPDILAKVDFLNPTLSFKDRGAVMLVALALAIGAQTVVVDSSGNAGTAIAAYAARAGLACEVYVPAATSPNKLTQAEHHGAKVIRVDGPRQAAADAAIERLAKGDAFYASHVYNPYFYEGTKTFAFEVWEQLGRIPERVVLPAGNGTLVLGTYLGFKELRDSGLAESLPEIIAVQSERCAPIAQAFDDGADEITPVHPSPSAAEGIAIAAPPRGSQILKAVRETGGSVIVAAESDIEPARRQLSHQGLFVEPTAAATYASLRHIPADGGMTVTVLTGAGLKAG